MARKQKLKVYRTPIGFHDAYVAAPSQKAALKAWGADVDLFARGVADTVVDDELTRAPLEHPGTVVRVPRGTSAEHMAALPEDRPARPRVAASNDAIETDEAPARRGGRRSGARRPTPDETDAKQEPSSRREAKPSSATGRKPKPKPSRAQLDDAERSLEAEAARHRETITAIREQEKALQRKRRDLEKRHDDEMAKLEAALDTARRSYGAALEKWRT